MKYYIQILGTDTYDLSPSVLVHFDGQRGSQRYLFNCGEGTQRFCLQNKLKLAKTKNIFITRVNWECVGGIPGMLLTLADSGTKEIKVLGEGSDFNDGNLLVKAVLITPNNFEMSSPVGLDNKKKVLELMFTQSSNNTEPPPQLFSSSLSTPSKKKRIKLNEDNAAFDIPDELTDEPSLEDQQPLVIESAKAKSSTIIREQRKKYFPKRLPKSKPLATSIAYICKGPDYKGKFDPKAAQALGLPPGKLYSQLVKGLSVTAPDGTIVHPDQVVGPSRPGLIFIIIDVPSTDYIQSVCSSPEFIQYQTTEDLQPKIIIHMLGKNVIQNQQYIEWMKKFGEKTEHIIASEEVCPQKIVFYNSALSQLKLSKLDEKQFAIPYYSNEPFKKLDDILNLPKKSSIAIPLRVYQMEPTFKIDDSQLTNVFDHIDPNSLEMQTLNGMTEYLEIVKLVKQKILSSASLSSDNSIQSQDPLPIIHGSNVSVTTLGTGSCLPSKYRNVSSTLIKIPQDGCILLDVGEGTLGSLYRKYGPLNDKPIINSSNSTINSGSNTNNEESMSLEKCLRDLKLIFISHMHADHHLGLIRLLDRWNQLRQNDGDDKSIYLMGPTRLWKWLNEYSDVQDFGISKVKFIDNKDVLRQQFSRNSDELPAVIMIRELMDNLKLRELLPVEVIHCPSSYGLCIEHTDNWKIVYSGDTRPCEELVRLGKNATLLIHEATFENDLAQEAKIKRHSTTEEAVQVVPIFTDDHGYVGISFDLMEVNIGELYKLPKYVEALKVLYPDESEEAKEEETDEEDI
nr:4504_t:CDS:10 [Entrophospora candida]